MCAMIDLDGWPAPVRGHGGAAPDAAPAAKRQATPATQRPGHVHAEEPGHADAEGEAGPDRWQTDPEAGQAPCDPNLDAGGAGRQADRAPAPSRPAEGSRGDTRLGGPPQGQVRAASPASPAPRNPLAAPLAGSLQSGSAGDPGHARPGGGRADRDRPVARGPGAASGRGPPPPAVTAFPPPAATGLGWNTYQPEGAAGRITYTAPPSSRTTPRPRRVGGGTTCGSHIRRGESAHRGP